ncbi:DDB1- and CUL4-associated factor 4 isoform X1 [Prionailurus iriomotensis]
MEQKCIKTTGRIEDVCEEATSRTLGSDNTVLTRGCNTAAQQSPQDSGRADDDEAPSTSSGTAGSSSAPDLPGYYFDPEKKRYFRLLPGHNNCNPLTKESIRHKEMESKRLQLLEEEDKQKKKIARMGFNASSLLQKNKLGFLNATSYCRLAHELRVSCMQRKKVQIQSSDPSALASDRFNLILADTNSDRLFTVNDVKVGGSKYGIISLRGLKTPSLKVHMHENLYFTNRKAKERIKIHIISFKDTVCGSFISYLPSGDHFRRAFHPGERPGLSRRVLVTNVVTGHRQSFGTSSDVLAQQFALMAPLLFNGCRSGEIFAIDLRCRNQGKGWKATRLFHDSAVTSVQILQEEQNLMASDMAGTIKLWDLRTTKCIRQYEGHVNEYAYLPLHVHEEEGIVVAALDKRSRAPT